VYCSLLNLPWERAVAASAARSRTCPSGSASGLRQAARSNPDGRLTNLDLDSVVDRHDLRLSLSTA